MTYEEFQSKAQRLERLAEDAYDESVKYSKMNDKISKILSYLRKGKANITTANDIFKSSLSGGTPDKERKKLQEASETLNAMINKLENSVLPESRYYKEEKLRQYYNFTEQRRQLINSYNQSARGTK